MDIKTTKDKIIFIPENNIEIFKLGRLSNKLSEYSIEFNDHHDNYSISNVNLFKSELIKLLELE